MPVIDPLRLSKPGGSRDCPEGKTNDESGNKNSSPAGLDKHQIMANRGKATGLPRLSVVVPVFGNQQTLEPLYHRLTDCLAGRRFEILFVNDASPDESLQILRRLAQTDLRVGCISLSTNRGQNPAVLTGIMACSADVVVCLDADLQDPPEMIPRLVERLLDNPGLDAVFGGRTGRYESWLRHLTSRLFKQLLHRTVGGKLPPDAGLFVVFSGRMKQRLLECNDPDPYLLELMGRSGLVMESIPVPRRPAVTSGYTFWKRLRLAEKAFTGTRRRRKCNRSRRRLDPWQDPQVEYFGAPFSHRKER